MCLFTSILAAEGEEKVSQQVKGSLSPRGRGTSTRPPDPTPPRYVLLHAEI